MNDAASGTAVIIERASQGWRPYVLLILLCLGLYLPGIAALPVLDRDEARFAQATRQMLESRDFLRIRFQNEARNKKPAGIYWLQAASVAALSDAESTTIWPYRLPSLIGATAAALLAFALGRALVGNAAALLGAALLASTLDLTVEAHLAKTDAVLLAAVVAAQGALGIIYRDARRGEAPARWGLALLFWTAQGLALLIKGPLAPVLSLLTAAALSIADCDMRWLRGLRPLWGGPLMLAIAAPWFIAITAATSGAFIGEAVGHDFFGKLVGAQEAHGAPPGYYLALLPVTFWPGSLFLGAAFAWGWRERSAPAVRFLVAWIFPFWAALELVPTKLPHYILPAYPALALLAGSALVGVAAASARRRWLDAIVTALWVVVSLVLAAALALLPLRFGYGVAAAGVVAGAIILLFGKRLVFAAWRAPVPGLAVRAVLLALLVFAPAFQFVAPRLDALWLSRGAAEIVARYRPPRDAPVVAVGYSEPSLVFLLGTATRFVSPDQAADYLTSARGASALVSDRDEAAFRAALETRGWEARPVDRVSGLDYSNGKAMTLTLYTGAPR
ncbi:MAG TPA: glycosyltransferase family 39 protein [Stellaceae bacterium]|nr:glycosyltransferase family 39 protein [Stellaceae bacterium]